MAIKRFSEEERARLRDAAFQAQAAKPSQIIAGKAGLSRNVSLNIALGINNGAVADKVDPNKSTILNLIDAKASVIIVTQDFLIDLFQMTKDEEFAKHTEGIEKWMVSKLSKLRASIESDYVIYQTNPKAEGTGKASDLFVLLPKQYIEAMIGQEACAKCGLDGLISALGLNGVHLCTVTVDEIPLTQNDPDTEFDVNVIEKVTNIVTRIPSEDPTSALRLFYWFGHGTPGLDGTIGGLKQKNSRELIKRLSIRTDLLYLESCFAGGVHTENIKNDLQALNPSHGQMILVMQAFGDVEAQIAAENQNFHAFFSKMLSFLRNGEGEFKEILLDASGFRYFDRFGGHLAAVTTRQSALVYLPGSATGFELQSINQKIAIIGNVQGRKHYEGQPLKAITMADKYYAVVAPHKVDAEIVIKGVTLPRMESKRGGLVYITFEKIKIEMVMRYWGTIEDVISKMFASDKDQWQVYSKKILVKSLEIGDDVKCENLFIKSTVSNFGLSGRKLEYYYKNAPELEHQQSPAIQLEIEQFEKTCTEQPDTASIDRTKLALDQIEKLVSLKIKALESLQPLDPRLSNHFDAIKDYFICKFKASLCVVRFGLTPATYEASIERKVSELTAGIESFSRLTEIKKQLKQIENTYTPQEEDVSAEQLVALVYERCATKVKCWERAFERSYPGGRYSKMIVPLLVDLEAQIEARFREGEQSFAAREEPRASEQMKSYQMKKVLAKIAATVSNLEGRLGQVEQRLEALKGHL